jgi:hypothetical protein
VAGGGDQVNFSSKIRWECEWDLSIVDVSNWKYRIHFLMEFLTVLSTENECLMVLQYLINMVGPGVAQWLMHCDSSQKVP